MNQVLVQSRPKHVAGVNYALDGRVVYVFVGALQTVLEQLDVLFHDLGDHRVVVNYLVGVEQEEAVGKK